MFVQYFLFLLLSVLFICNHFTHLKHLSPMAVERWSVGLIGSGEHYFEGFPKPQAVSALTKAEVISETISKVRDFVL